MNISGVEVVKNDLMTQYDDTLRELHRILFDDRDPSQQEIAEAQANSLKIRNKIAGILNEVDSLGIT